jgi:prevent-host-death family protein
MCYPTVVTTIGLRELRQQASDLLRRVEAGEELTVTVAGRPSARLVPVAPAAWRSWTEIADLFAGPADDDWAADRDRLDAGVRDPWQPRR